MRYLFNEVDHCNMCGADSKLSKVMGKRLNHSQGLFPKRKKGITTTIVKCENCGLVYSDPQPVPFDIQDHYGIPPESYWTENYFKISKEYFQHEISTYKKINRLSPDNNRALDIGAGIGKAMIALNNAGFDAFGFEPSVTFYEQGKKK